MLYVCDVPKGIIFILCCVLLSSPAVLAAGSSEVAPVAKSPARELAGEIVSVDGKVFVRADGKGTAAKLQPAKPGDPVYSGDVVNTASNGKVKILMKDKSIMDLGPSGLLKMDHFEKNGGPDRQADVSMMYGTLRAAISQKIQGKGRFNVRTPAATMGVRGTEFVVKSEVSSLKEVKHAVLNPGKPMPGQQNSKAGKGDDAKAPSAPKTEITVLQGQVDVKKQAPKEPPRDPKDKSPRKLASVDKVISLTAGTQLTTKPGEALPSKPVTLDTMQLKTIVNEVKVQDNTFQKAVVIDVGSGSGSTGSSKDKNGGGGFDANAGQATRTALSTMLTLTVTPPVTIGDIGIPGVPTVASAFNNRPTNNPTGDRSLHVNVVVK